ncbi:hypothetical protein ACHQM5_020214 [Ranunculus cassubicifolius]
MEEDLPNPNQTSNANADDISQKHSAMISRLTDLHQSRLQQRSNSSSNSTSTFESTNSFLTQFSSYKQSIQNNLDKSHNISDPKSHLDEISSSISDLEKFVAENSYFLPNYEVRSSLKTISDLREKLEVVNSELLPKKKFAFKSKSKAKDSVNLVKETKVKDEIVENSVSIRDSPGFRDREGEVLVQSFGESEVGEFTLSNLSSCDVRLSGRMRAVFVHKLRNCRVFVGPIMGSFHIEDVEDCVFVLASHQIRIHHAKRTDFYLRVRSRPIIEDSSNVRFAPYAVVYEGIENDLKKCSLDEDTGNWGNVDDFRWLRAVQSPNWCVLPEEERIEPIHLFTVESLPMANLKVSEGNST